MSDEYERLLTCYRCRETVRVGGGGWIDPDLYVCGRCLVPVEHDEQGEQLSLGAQAVGLREETRLDYDPAIARIPF